MSTQFLKQSMNAWQLTLRELDGGGVVTPQFRATHQCCGVGSGERSARDNLRVWSFQTQR